ncbi:SMC-Scp complex subunit ScpB [Catellatospora tritici]|uniref:SMC-Scp complex subunit ScpB n=1 Tax=Catellatospora tritici TaxID=2851566 RepID=UPI003FD7AB73
MGDVPGSDLFGDDLSAPSGHAVSGGDLPVRDVSSADVPDADPSGALESPAGTVGVETVDSATFDAEIFGGASTGGAGPVAASPVAAASAQLGVAAPGLSPLDLVPALEAIMLVVDEPVSELTLAQVLDMPAEEIAATLIELSAAYTRQNRGFDLRRAAGGWRLYTRADYAPYVERFVLDGQQLRLTQASLETLAVIAYKQPVTRSRISAIRGVNCDGVVRTLVTRGMIEECGTEPESGAYLYRTTTLFLEKLGLDSVDQLPPLAPFLPDNVEEIADEQR